MQAKQTRARMCDLRPAAKTGILNVTKKNIISEQKTCNKEKTTNVKAYVLGMAVDSNTFPIFHDEKIDFKKPSPLEIENQRIQAQTKQRAEFAWAERAKQQKQVEELEQQKEYFQRLEQEVFRRQAAEKEKIRVAQMQRIAFEQAEKARKEKMQREKAEALRIERELQFQIAEQKKQEEKLRQEKILEEQRWLAEYERMKKLEEEKIKQQQKLAEELKWKEFARMQKEKEDARLERFKKAQRLLEEKKKRTDALEKLFKNFSWRKLLQFPYLGMQIEVNRNMISFAVVALVLLLGVGTVSYASKGLGLKGRVLGMSSDGLNDLSGAISDMAHQNFQGSSEKFSEALANFSQGSQDLNDMGGILLDATKYVPFASKISSGKNAMEAGKHFSAAGKALNEVAKVSAGLKNPISPDATNNISLLDVFQSAKTNIAIAKTELDAAQKNIDQISVDDLPKDKQNKFILLKQKLPDIRKALDLFLSNSNILFDLLGGNGPRKYLFLFQNNSEMRATGGFIGSYGLLDIANGRIKKFFIDGIFNPDGQLRDKIVPPAPIQKISANWSMHDSNWFPNFPDSARKAIYFYEKTGGPTADGVITFTPALMQKLLKITGPIEMPEYGVTLDADNFMEMTQYKVEVDYDKAENQPKKILSDLAPLVLDKLLASRDLDTITHTANAILEGLQEKHILLYSENASLEKMISNQSWSGEILPSSKDYISVINTNINGFKTDAVVDENIKHQAQIQDDGSIVDTVTITRKHSGGKTQYEWLNKVNADYMRVYVPEGSKLLEVSGQTREVDKPPLDYDALGFKRDGDVQQEEQGIIIDSESGTQIYNESGKTVFANWTYVSPGETMTITYKYKLPFSLFQVSVGDKQQIDSYSLVVQKQSGSMGSSFESKLEYPQSYNLKWNFPQSAQQQNNEITNSVKLTTDHFYGEVFEKN